MTPSPSKAKSFVLGRRRRRVVRIVKKKLPTVFVCPRCGEEAVRVTIAKGTGKATVMCALCQLKDEFPAHPAAQMIDVYSYFADRFYGVKDPRAIIPRERESRAPAPDEEPEAHEEALDEAAPPQEAEPSITSPEQDLEPKPQGPTPADAAEPSSPIAEESPPEEAPATAPGEVVQGSPEEKPLAEEEEPFADILGSKDKKRYSPNPLPQQQSEQTTQSSD